MKAILQFQLRDLLLLITVACVLAALVAAGKLVLGLIIALLLLATLIKTGWLPRLF